MDLIILGIIGIVFCLFACILHIIGVPIGETPCSGWKTIVVSVCFAMCVFFTGISEVVNPNTCPECEQTVNQDYIYRPDCSTEIDSKAK